jgi:3-carboxy-cis,cis-muconate cycloisomerase
MSDPTGVDPHDALFGDRAVAQCFTPRARFQSMLDVEAALAEAGARAGVIPEAAVGPIKTAAHADFYDLSEWAEQTALDGNPAIPLVRQLTRTVARQDANAAGYVHWGATSQDLIDTSLVLRLRTAVPLVLGHLERAASAAAAHARVHIDTVMPGRTLLSHATPVTFGLKAAGWLDAIGRDRESLANTLNECLVLQLGGASGTLAALGDAGPRVADRLGEQLALRVPDLPWHTHRDRLVRLASALGITCGVCGKIARDLVLLAQTEVGEAFESRVTGGGSSTMPHKRNPVSASVALAAAVRAPGLVATLLTAMPQEHERSVGGWHAEWTTLPELVELAGGAARAIADALEGLTVDADRMRANLEITRGFVLAEAVTMTLAEHVGRFDAYTLVEKATRRATADRSSLADALAADPAVCKHVTRAQIEQRLTPDSYLGAARVFVERVLARWTRNQSEQA